MKAKNIIVDPQTLQGDVWLCGISPYKDDTGTGYRYECVLPNVGFEKFNVKIPGKQQLTLTEDEGVVVVNFQGLQLSFYTRTQKDSEYVDVFLTGRATGIAKVPQK